MSTGIATQKADTLLLVDDEAGIRKVLRISLEDRGFTVHTAENGAQALRRFREFNPPIVLTDIKMPDMDGIALLGRIKQENADTEVIMFTGHGDMDLAIRSLKNDATDFVTKPINDDALEIAIRRAQERITMRSQIREYTQHLERLVEEKARQLIQAERMAAVGEAIAGLAHTIKNITGSLDGGMFVLQQGIETGDRHYLDDGWQMIHGNVDKIRNLSLDLLNYGKYGQIHRVSQRPDLPLEEVAAAMRPRMESHGIALRLDLSPHLQPILLDPEAIYHCLLNLATNAMDACLEIASPRGSPEVVLTADRAKGWGVVYRVSDTGPGLDAERQKMIFSSFFSTKGTHGTGIGLMMTQKIVLQHGGEIDFQSREGSGSTFRICLPEA